MQGDSTGSPCTCFFVMEDILELIIAIVAGFFWLFGGSLFKRREEDESYQPTSSQRSNRRKSKSSSNEQEARQQEIRETIRRKIAERRQQSNAEPVLFPEPEPQYQRQSTELQEEMNKPPAYASPSDQEATKAPFSLDMGNSHYGQEMQERLNEIESTKRRAEALKKKVKQVTQDHYTIDRRKSSDTKSVLSFGSVQTTLKNPATVRMAFVYSEILGKPVSLRSSSQIGIEG
jgi:hypothetical protein